MAEANHQGTAASTSAVVADEEAAVKPADAAAHDEHNQNEQAKGGWFANACLLGAVLLFSANNSVLLYMLNMGPPYFTTCNILCTSNLIAAATTWPLFHKDIRWAKIRALRWRDWLAIFFASIFRNVAGAYFEVEGLSLTSVPTFAIVEMLEPVEFLLFALCLMPHERRNLWIFGNAALLVVGVMVALFEPALEGKAVPAGQGVLYLAIGGFFYVLAELIGHLFLERIPLGIYAIGRVLLGTLFFHLLALGEGSKSREGTTALENIYSAHLWAQMAWYGVLFVTIGQYVWLTALSRCRPQTISLGTSSMFLFNLAFAAIILGSSPTKPQYIGSVFILVSIASSLLEARRHKEQEGEVEEERPEEGGAEPEADAQKKVEGDAGHTAGANRRGPTSLERRRIVKAADEGAMPSKHF